MQATVIIPARYASMRFPGKVLKAETGKYLIQHVVESVEAAQRIKRVVIATDDERIVDAVASFGGEAVMTSAKHTCGTERIAEAAEKLDLADGEIVVNVQGDEPEMLPECVDTLVETLVESSAPMATLVTPMDAGKAEDPNKVKVVLSADGMAIYFSRAKIPFDRDNTGGVKYLLHLGIYAYRVEFLKKFCAMKPTVAELAEKLEQLRALEHGESIAVAIVDYGGIDINTPADYDEFISRMKR